MKKLSFNKLSDILFVSVVFVVLIFGFVVALCLPKDVNKYENRKSNKITALTISSFADLSFQDNMENALADQLPKAISLKKLYNDISAKFIGSFLEPVIMTNPDTYINYNGTYFYGGGYIYLPYNLEEIKPLIVKKADNYNSVIKKYSDIEFFAYYIQRDTDINFSDNKKLGADEYLFNILNIDADKKATFSVSNFNEYNRYFYKTDHHWNHIGSYKAYTELVNLFGFDNPLKPLCEVKISDGFSGSKAAALGSDFLTETFSAYSFDFSPMEITVNNKKVADYGTWAERINTGSVSKVSYGSFYGSDAGEIVFSSGREELGNILVIGESYDNAVLKLLAEHFNNTHAVDLRNYEHYMGHSFNFGEYIATNKIDKVLFIGNANFYTTEKFSLENY